MGWRSLLPRCELEHAAFHRNQCHWPNRTCALTDCVFQTPLKCFDSGTGYDWLKYLVTWVYKPSVLVRKINLERQGINMYIHSHSIFIRTQICQNTLQDKNGKGPPMACDTPPLGWILATPLSPSFLIITRLRVERQAFPWVLSCFFLFLCCSWRNPFPAGMTTSGATPIVWLIWSSSCRLRTSRTSDSFQHIIVAYKQSSAMMPGTKFCHQHSLQTWCF